MKTNKTTRVLCVMAMLGSASGILAQEDVKKEEEKNLNREMTLEREYDPSVQDANKVNTLPAVKQPTVTKRSIDYATFTVPTEPEKQLTTLPSGKIMTDMEYNRRRGYLNLAAGMHLNIDGDFGYHILDTEKDRLDFSFSHRSTNGNIDYIQIDQDVKAKLNDNLGRLAYRHVFDKAIFNIGAKYGYSGFNYYGLPVSDPEHLETELEKIDRETNQVNQTIGANIGVESKEGASFGYLFDLDYINFSHKYGAAKAFDGPTENTFDLRFNLFAPFGGNQQIGLGGQAVYFNYSLPDEGCEFKNHAEVTLNPYYRVEGENWKVKLGAKVMFVTGDDSEFMASPDIAADVKLAEKTQLYLNAGGKLYSNSMYEMAQLNRYINPTEEVAPSRNWLDGVLGIRSGVVPGFWFDVFAGYKMTSSDVLFLPSRGIKLDEFGNFSEVERFVNTKQFYAGVNLKYSYLQYLDLRLKGVYNHWTADYDDSEPLNGGVLPEIEHAWGKPTAEITAGVTVRPIKNLALDLDYYLATDRYSATRRGEDIKLDNINELNLRATYTFSPTIGVNVRLNNLLAQKYDIYYGYPAQGFNLMAGVNLNF